MAEEKQRKNGGRLRLLEEASDENLRYSARKKDISLSPYAVRVLVGAYLGKDLMARKDPTADAGVRHALEEIWQYVQFSANRGERLYPKTTQEGDRAAKLILEGLVESRDKK